jgi:formylglycine-generating enzyme required for sulfatase activity/serine/threonine protein kinase
MYRKGERIGPYVLVDKLGRGTFGEVWLAEKKTSLTTTRVALKIPNDDDIELQTIEQEASVWVTASGHPNIIPIIEADVYDGQIVIASEYAPDGSLATLLKRYGGKAPSYEVAVEITIGVLNGLEHLHSRKIIHRDLKPGNILFQGRTPRLVDFGLSRVMKSSSHNTTVSGTFAYMPPEGFDGRHSTQTDIWAAGVMLYEMLSGRLPYPQADMASMVAAVLMRSPDALPPDVPPALGKIVQRAIDKDLSNRYVTAAQMREDLIHAMQDIKEDPTTAATSVLNNDSRIRIPEPDFDAQSKTLVSVGQPPGGDPHPTYLPPRADSSHPSGPSAQENPSDRGTGRSAEATQSWRAPGPPSTGTDQTLQFSPEQVQEIIRNSAQTGQPSINPNAPSFGPGTQGASPYQRPDAGPGSYSPGNPNLISQQGPTSAYVPQGPAAPNRIQVNVDPQSFGSFHAPPQTPPAKSGKSPIIWLALLLLPVLAIAAVGAWWIMKPAPGTIVDGDNNNSKPGNNSAGGGTVVGGSSQAVPDGMVMVPGGDFTMGRNDGEVAEQPEHRASVKAFFIDKTEVTNDEYKKFVDATSHKAPTTWKNGGYNSVDGHKPVTGVTWDDAQAYAAWANKRLPTEEEWEFAAKGTTGNIFPWGKTWIKDNANANGANKGVVDVGKYKGASPFGALDMAGNAWEWTATEFKPYDGGKVPPNLPSGELRTLRGGSFESSDRFATTTYRAGWPARGGQTYDQTSFRCVRDVKE